MLTFTGISIIELESEIRTNESAFLKKVSILPEYESFLVSAGKKTLN